MTHKSRAKTIRPTALLPEPWPVPVRPPFPGGEPNVIPASALNLDLRIEYSAWSSVPLPGEFQYVHLYLDDVDVAQKAYDGSAGQEYYILLPRQHMLADGTFKLHYDMVDENNNHNPSAPIFITLDHTRPYYNGYPGRPVLPTDVGAQGVDAAYLASHGDQVLLSIPAYGDCKVGDLIEVYWRNASPVPGDDVVAASRYIAALEPPGPIDIAVTGDAIRARGPGNKVLVYYLTDRAGNISNESQVTFLDVNLPAPPTGLQPPRVIGAEFDNLIDRDDACTGVYVEVDAYGNPLRGDQLVIWFNSTELGTLTLPANPQFAQRMEVPWPILSAYGEQSIYQAMVYYTVRRGGVSVDSQVVPFNVDLRIPGPPNASPCRANAQLPSVTVKGRTGYNLIVEADAPGPVPVEVQLYAPAKANELLELFWGSLTAPVAEYRVKVGDVPGITITFEVPWENVVDVGSNPALAVAYTVSNGVNVQRSPTTPCRVDFATQDNSLPAPLYPKPGSLGPEEPWSEIIANYNCAGHPWRGLVIKIPPDDRFVADSRIVLNWRGYSTSNLAESSFLPGTQYQEERVITAATQKQEVTFTILPADFRRCILATSYRGQGEGQSTFGSGYAYYTLYSPGQPATYNEHKQSYCRINLVRPGSHCPCTWDGYPTEGEDWCLDCDPITDGSCTPQP